MGCLGNLLWFICGGFLSGLSWLFLGCLWCITIIGIPIGKQCFKFAELSFFPFGKEVSYGGGAGFSAPQYYLAHCDRGTNGFGVSGFGSSSLRYHCGDSLRNPAF